MADREKLRIKDLASFDILDSPGEDSYDHIVALAMLIADTPAAYITFVDERRLWFKSVEGLPSADIPREQTFCQFVVESGTHLLIEDAWYDPRFSVLPDGSVMKHKSPLVPEAEGTALDSSPKRSGLIRFYLGVPLRSGEGNILGTLCVADFSPRSVDGTVIRAMERLAEQVIVLLELRRTNAALAAERETFTILFEVAPVPLVLLEGGRIRRANHVFGAIVTDRDTDALEGLEISRFLENLPDSPGDLFETEIRNEAGVIRPVALYCTRLQIQKSNYQLIALYDISDRKEKERVLSEHRTQAENAARIKDTFLSLVSHDLKSPLSGIYAMLDLLATAGDSFSEEDRDEAIRDLRSSTALMMEMIQQLLNIHRLESGQLRAERSRAEIRPITGDILLSLSKQISEKSLFMDVAVASDFSLFVDEALFREALFNLISNAVKFSPPGRTVRIEGKPYSHGGGEVQVIDRGGGVPPEDLPNLFRKDIKTSRPGTAGEGGTGLGLPLVMDIMQAHGGDVSVRYTGLHGTCFVLTVPPADP